MWEHSNEDLKEQLNAWTNCDKWMS